MEFKRTSDSCFGNLADYPFAPNYVEVDDQEGGKLRMHYVDEGMLFQKAFAAGAQLAANIKNIVKVELIAGPQEVDQIWKDMLDNKVSAQRGIMTSLNR